MADNPQQGAEEYQLLLDGGFSLQEAEQYKAETKQLLLGGGFSQKEANAYFGEIDPKDPQDTDGMIRDNYARFRELATSKGAKEADPDDMWQMVLSGWGMSATGLGVDGIPKIVSPRAAGFFGRLAEGLAQGAGDAPASFAAMLPAMGIGGSAGAVAGGPAAPATATVGAVAAAGAAMAAAPEFVRQMLMDGYNNGQAHTAEEVFERGMNVLFATAKQAVVGGVTAPIGGAVGSKVLNSLGTKVVLESGAKAVISGMGARVAATGANDAAQALAGTALFGAMEGRIPDLQDFTVATALVVGNRLGGSFVGATRRYVQSAVETRVQKAMMDVYTATGEMPAAQAERARTDPAFKAELMSVNAAGETVVSAATREATPVMRGTLTPEEPAVGPKIEEGADPIRTVADHDIEVREREEPLREKPMGAVMSVDHALAYLSGLENSEGYAQAHGISEHDVVSPKGAVGRYQIMPGTATQYGFDPKRLHDPEYNLQVAKAIVKDLTGRYRFPDGSVDFEAVAIAYNAGPGRADKFRANGRDYSKLPKETQLYLDRAQKMGAITHNGAMESHIQVDGIKPYEVDWGAFLKNKDFAMRRGRGGRIETDPNSIASYLQKLGREAGFKFVITDPMKEINSQGPAYIRHAIENNGRLRRADYVYMPDNPDELFRRWYGLGRSEILFHEVGHALDHKILKSMGKSLTGAIRDEMEVVSRKFRPKLWEMNPKYNLKPDELRADAIAMWLSNPDIRKEMPEFNKAYAEQLAPYVYLVERNLPVRKEGGDWSPPPENGPTPEKSYEDLQISIGNGGKGGGGKPPGPPGGTAVGPAGKPPPPKKPPFPLTEDMLMAKVEDMIAKPDRPSLIDQGENLVDSTIRKVFSELSPFRKVDNALRKEGVIDEKAFGLEDGFRMTYSSGERAAAMMQDGAFGVFDRKLKNDASMHNAFKAAKEDGGTKQGFINYMLARRSLEKAEQGIKTTNKFTPEEAAQLIKLAGGKYERAAKVLQKSLDGLVDYIVESGRLSEASGAEIKAQNRYYIPFNRHIEGEQVAANVPRGKGFAVRQNIKEMKGSDRDIVEPMAALVEHYITSVTLSDRNVAIRNLVSMPEFRDSFGAKRIEDARVPDEVTLPDGTKVTISNNAPLPPGTPTDAITALQLEQGRKLGASEFIYFNKGKPEVWSVASAEIAKVIRGTTFDESNIFIKAAAMVANMQRKGVTETVDFTVRNLIRDSVGASILVKSAGLPFQNVIEGFWGAMASTPGFKEFCREGGLGAALSDMDRDMIQYQVDKVFDDTGVSVSVSNTFNSILEVHRIMMERTDAMGRYGHYKKLVREGTAPAKAAMESRKARLDFKEKGTDRSVAAIAATSTFFRPRLLGWKQLAEQVASDPKGVAMRGVLYATLPSIAAYFMWVLADEDRAPDDPARMENVDQWVRDGFLVFNLPGGEQVRTPKAFEIGTIFGTSVERLLDYSYKKDPKAFKTHALQWLGSQASDLLPFSTAAKPIVEHALGMSTFTGRPLNPPSQEQASGYMQFTPYTTETAKSLARILGPNNLDVANVSGPVIENYVRGWGGTLGMTVLKLFDRVSGPDVKPRTWADNEFIGSLFLRKGMIGKPITDFYDGMAEIATLRKDLALSKQRGDFATMDRVMQQELSFLKLDGISEALANIRETIQRVTDNKEMSKVEKRQLIDQMAMTGIGIAKEAVKVIDEVKK